MYLPNPNVGQHMHQLINMHEIVPHALAAPVWRMCFAASQVSCVSEQGGQNRDKWLWIHFSSVLTDVVLCPLVGLHLIWPQWGMNACLDIQLGQEWKQDKACSVTQISACTYISGVSTAVHTCSKNGFCKKFCLKKLSLAALMLQRIRPCAGSSFGFTRLCRVKLKLPLVFKLLKAKVLVTPEGRL